MEHSIEKTILKPATLMAPAPVILVSCNGLPAGECDKPNMITLAWAGTICTSPPMVSVSIRKSRYSYRQIIETKEFVINLVSENILKQTDYCGVKSGHDIDKFKECQLTPVPAAGLKYAPAVAESPVSLSCQLRQIIELGSHDCFIAEIVAVSVTSKYINKQNQLCMDQAKLVAYCHGEYLALGQKLGFFGYSVASEKALARRMPKSRKSGTN